MLYGAESWTTLDKHMSRVTAAEMRYLRRIVGKNRRDRIRNETVRQDLEVGPVSGILEERQLKWLGHASRADETKKIRQFLEAKPEGKRPRGRPRLAYQEYMVRLGEVRGSSWWEMRRMMGDRLVWRRWTEAQNHPTLRGRRVR
ncbi:uncharacterized protein LOC111055686 [Nilaparvata lugens]|uniref:uncharacterized protein LOC111055686 n=1 Tax=Nilaparvata lugens TaxID=108931 RepID=UPI000B99B568|nr:uncharacterized protein LOC111055686 [Nilaparvata lugens]